MLVQSLLILYGDLKSEVCEFVTSGSVSDWYVPRGQTHTYRRASTPVRVTVRGLHQPYHT